MTNSELDSYLKARRQQYWSIRISILAGAIFVLSGALYLLGIQHNLSGAIAAGSLLGALIGSSDAAPLAGASVTRGDLLKLIELQINRDPDAVRYVAGRR